ncbi:hypothetical protein HQ865_09860 [Mucilaginibacter mali]|uniref:Uncharacterized protein n=1 Tax=Mucilaginibacter mali TaxID=2740462 RepID=A0A7D4QSI8_9SPHI|nr:hypothetical protein [Mucilaginibacter mali]QKJ30049.1 hypothetical protein HQ865_09860 [Mucilaginibacter mali]
MGKKTISNSDITDWVKLGSEITGSTAGALIGSYFAGVGGAVIGASITPLINETISKIGGDFKNMFLGRREEVRIGATFSFALNKIKQRLDAGETPRLDSFFNMDNGNRPASEEILEAALRLAQREHEELKIKHYGYLIANIYFDDSIDRAYANFLINIANRLSYRKLLLIELFNNTEKFELYQKRKIDNTPPHIVGGVDLSLYSSNKLDLRAPLKRRKVDLSVEIDELELYYLINKESGIKIKPLADSFAHIGLTNIGSDLRRLMELKELNTDDLEEVASVLRYKE